MTYFKFLKTIPLLFAVGIAACVQHGQVTDGDTATAKTPQAIIQDLRDWWPGDYDNRQQIVDLLAAGKPVWRADDSGEGGHIEVESHYRVVELPQFGDHVLYVEELKHGDASNIFRQRLYTLSVDSVTGQVKVKLWYFNDKKKYVGAWRNLERLNELTTDDMFASPDGCDLYVSQQPDGRYHMKMREKQCGFGERYFNYQVLLGKNSFGFRDKIQLFADDSIVSVAGDFTYHELLRMP